MLERFLKIPFTVQDKYSCKYYHFHGECVVRQIVIDADKGDVVSLTREHPKSGAYGLYGEKYSEIVWPAGTLFISEYEFNQTWASLPSLDFKCDRYAKEASLDVSDTGEEYSRIDYVHFHGIWPVRQITILNGMIMKFTTENPVLGEFGLCDQPLYIYGDQPANFISREEFEEAWNKES